MILVAPCLRVGRGLKPAQPGRGGVFDGRCALPSGGARIETHALIRWWPSMTWVAPCLRVGRGLKRLPPHRLARLRQVAPCLRVGRGLKLGSAGRSDDGGVRCALPSGGARIETTGNRRSASRSNQVAPCLRVGRGLKHRRGGDNPGWYVELRPAFGWGED